MAALDAHELQFLDRLSAHQKIATVGGLVLTALGAAYVVWAVAVFDYRIDPRTQVSFDAPVANLAFLYDRYQRTIDKIVPETQVETWLFEGIRRGMWFSAGVMVLMLRAFLGTLMFLAGLIALTVVVERRRLLKLIHKLSE